MDWEHVFAIASAVIGATWVLRSKLGDIEVALRGHVAQDEERHLNLKAEVEKQDGRIIKLEEYRGRR